MKLYYFLKGLNRNRMVPVTKEEKNLLKRKYPDLCIARTMKQDSKRHNYFCEERPGAMGYLDRLRQRGVVYDSRYPNGKPPVKQDERKPWQKNSQNGNKNSGRGGVQKKERGVGKS